MSGDRSRPPSTLAWFAGNSVAANILMIAMLVAGGMAALSMRTEVFPPIDPRSISVSVTYAGASTEEVEGAIVARVEGTLTGLSGIKQVSGSAQEGLGTVTADLKARANADAVLSDIRDAVDQISDFPPEGAEDPIVTKTALMPQVMTLALYGDVSERMLRETAVRLQDDLLGMSAFADVSLAGAREYEMSIEVDPRALERHGLTIETLAQSITAASLDLSGGTLKTNAGDILLRTSAKRTSAEAFGDIPVLVQDGSVALRLRDVATVRDGFADGDLVTLYNGAPAVFLTIYRAADQGVLDIEARLRSYLETVAIPQGLTLAVRDNDTDSLRARINLMLRNALFGFGLVFLSLVLFLDLRLAFWTSVAIPISFLGGLAIAGALGASINMISLFALILVLGIVVDDAVVIGENIFDAQSRGDDLAQAALTGLAEVAGPVTLGVLTTILAFAPLAFTSGTLGQIVGVVPIVVIAILAVSLIEGLLILPAHLSHGSAWSMWPLRMLQSAFARGLQAFTRAILRPLVRCATVFRYAVMATVAGAMVLAVTALASGLLPFVFLPPTEAERVELTITLPEGAPFAQTQVAAEAALQAAQAVNAGGGAARAISATIGQVSEGAEGPGATSSVSAAHIAQVRVDLLPSDARSVTSAAFERRWRETLGPLPGVESMTFSSGLFELGADISIDLSHRDSTELRQASKRLRTALAAIDGVSNVEASQTAGKRELAFTLTETGAALGLTETDLARQIRRAFYGETVQTLQRGREDVDVVLRYPPEARASLADIYDMRIALPGGGDVPISSVAILTESVGVSTIERAQGRRVVTVSALVDSSVTTADAVNAVLEREIIPDLTGQTPGLTWSASGGAADQRSDLNELAGAFGMALLAIFVLLASFTRSYVLPLIILTTVIYGVLGAIVGHALLGYPLTFVSLFGIVALSGVVINDTILLLDDYRRRQARMPEQPKAEALVDSAARRFRPILMTTLSTAIGLLPMIFEPSTQAQFLVPMAISLGFGILVATPILLLAIPATLLILDDLGRPFRRVSASYSRSTRTTHADG